LIATFVSAGFGYFIPLQLDNNRFILRGSGWNDATIYIGWDLFGLASFGLASFGMKKELEYTHCHPTE
jgi:hypothetical protein